MKFQKIKIILYLFFSILYASLIFSYARKVITRSYVINESNLYKIDSIRVANRIFKVGKSGSHNYEFQATNGFIFSKREIPLLDESFFYDTLKHSGTSVTIYTNELGIRNYKTGSKSEEIEIYQIAIGDKKYADIVKLNEGGLKKVCLLILFYTLLYVFILVCISNLKKR